MSFAMARFALMSVALCICQVASAQDQLHFWTPAGDHGIDGCFFTRIPLKKITNALGG